MHQLAAKLQNYHVVLGSASPRRKELLAGLDIPFEVRVSETDESVDVSCSLEDVPLYVAKHKFETLKKELKKNEFLITADTLVFCDTIRIGKPQTLEEAKMILEQLSGKNHTVVTGVCIGTIRHNVSFYDKAYVKFAELASQDIDYYVENYHPLDKAGAYGVQEWIGYMGIEKIQGSFYTVMGLPVQKLYTEILSYEE